MTIRLVSAESVTEGHPDKLCDQVSDALLDAYLAQDPDSRVAVETFAVGGRIVVGGEVRSNAQVDVEQVVRRTVASIGYINEEEDGFSASTCIIENIIQRQSQEIADGVESSLEQRESDSMDRYDVLGAGDQGIMFGYAQVGPNYMPVQIELAHRLSRRLTWLRKNFALAASILRPDGKTQVTIEYEDDIPVRIDTVLISTQHSRHYDLQFVRDYVQREVIDSVIAEYNMEFGEPGDDRLLSTEGTRYIINPAGPFVLGGPAADTGLTGRKIIVDTYGGAARHGGGAFSGKDPSKVDRSAAYALRWAAKNVIAAGLAEKVEIQVAYAIGVAHPVGLYVDTFGTGLYDDEVVADAVSSVFDLRPLAIIDNLELKQPRYLATAAGGHFGRTEGSFTWESVSEKSMNALRDAVQSYEGVS